MRHQLPTPQTLLLLLENTPVRFVDRAILTELDEDGEPRRREVYGYYDDVHKEIVIARRRHRERKAAELVLTLIHELLHATVPGASERWIRRHDLVYYSNAELRQASAFKLLDAALYPEAIPDA